MAVRKELIGKAVQTVLVRALDFDEAMDAATDLVKCQVASSWRFAKVVGKAGEEHVTRISREMWSVEVLVKDYRPVRYR